MKPFKCNSINVIFGHQKYVNIGILRTALVTGTLKDSTVEERQRAMEHQLTVQVSVICVDSVFLYSFYTYTHLYYLSDLCFSLKKVFRGDGWPPIF